MRALVTTTVALAIALAVVWLLTKMSRSDAADLRLTALGAAVAVALLALVAGMAGKRERRSRP